MKNTLLLVTATLIAFAAGEAMAGSGAGCSQSGNALKARNKVNARALLAKAPTQGAVQTRTRIQ